MVSSQSLGHRVRGHNGQCLGLCRGEVYLALPARRQDVAEAKDEEHRRRVVVPKSLCVQEQAAAILALSTNSWVQREDERVGCGGTEDGKDGVI